MKKLSPHLEGLKEKLFEQKKQDESLRAAVSLAISTVIDVDDPFKTIIEKFYTKDGTLYVITKSKAVASELFMNKGIILKNVTKATKKVINEVVIM